MPVTDLSELLRINFEPNSIRYKLQGLGFSPDGAQWCGLEVNRSPWYLGRASTGATNGFFWLVPWTAPYFGREFILTKIAQL